VVLICLGLATDLTTGNRSLDVKVNTVVNHTQPSFTFCPVGERENVRPNVVYCTFASQLSVKEDAPVDREYGDMSNDCAGDLNAIQPNTWREHPIDPACWFLGDDVGKLLIPNSGTENAFIVFEAEGIGMRVWNSSEAALSSNPANSTASQGIRLVFGSGDLIQLEETSFKQLGSTVETNYNLRQFGSFALATVGLTNVSIVVLTWESDQVFATEEKETISVLTLTAIILGAVAVAMDLILKNFMLLFYQIFIYERTDEGIDKSVAL